MFAMEKDYLIYQGNLDSEHWLIPLVQNLSAETLSIELINETHTAQFQGTWRWIQVRFCDAYRIHLGEDSIEISKDAFYQGHYNSEEAIVPKGDNSAQLLTQVSSYRNEYDEFQEPCYETDCDAFVAFVVANTVKDPALALKRLLPDFNGCPSLYGKAFTLWLDENGSVQSVAALSNLEEALPAKLGAAIFASDKDCQIA